MLIERILLLIRNILHVPPNDSKEQVRLITYCIIPNRSTGRLDKSPGGCYIRFREPEATGTNMILLSYIQC